MTIKELEATTGLVRANVRYYESQGLISPARKENGYRSYSQEDADTLLKVKLLRQLHFSLEDIQALQKGERTLDAALGQKLRDLEQERLELDGAVRLCQRLQADRVSYATLDAPRYLDQVPPQELGGVLDRDQIPPCKFPWRRFFARTLDHMLYAAATGLFFQLVLRANILRGDFGFLRTLIPLLLMLGGETLLLHYKGTTLGKALFGLKILRLDGGFLSLEQAFRRTGSVMLFFGGVTLLSYSGLPFLFALAGLALEIYALVCVYRERPLFWDNDDYLYLEGSTPGKPFWNLYTFSTSWRIAAFVLCCALCFAASVGGYLLASTPFYHGANLTVSQFTANYNQMDAFLYGKSSTTLGEDGRVEKNPLPAGQFVIDLFDDGGLDPVFRYEQDQEGTLQKVTLLRSYEGIAGEMNIPYREMALSVYSFLWHGLGRNQTAALVEDIYAQREDFHYSYPNVEIDCQLNEGGWFIFSMTRTEPGT